MVFLRETPTKIDDLGVPPFQETTIFIGNIIGNTYSNIQYPLLTLLLDSQYKYLSDTNITRSHHRLSKNLQDIHLS